MAAQGDKVDRPLPWTNANKNAASPPRFRRRAGDCSIHLKHCPL